MSTPNITGEAQQSVNDYKQTLAKGGSNASDNAYKAFMKDISDEKGTLSASDYNKFLSQIQSDINGDKDKGSYLPSLTLEYAKQNQAALSDGNGNLNKSTIATAEAREAGGSFAQNPNPIDPLSKYLDGQIPGDLSSGKTKDINGAITTQDDNAAIKLAATEMLDNGKGFQKGLFDVLDNNAKGGAADGIIGQNDVQNALKNWGTTTAELQAMGYNGTEIAQMKTGLQTMDNDWKNGNMKQFEQNGAITMQSLATGLGYNGDVNALQAGEKAQMESASATSIAAGVFKPAARVATTTDTTTTPTTTTTTDTTTTPANPQKGTVVTAGDLKLTSNGDGTYTYSVASGDTLTAIANQIAKNNGGDPSSVLAEIEAANKFTASQDNNINVGQVIQIPDIVTAS